LGGVILGVLRQVAVGARVGNLLDDAGPLDLLAVLELPLQRLVAGLGHRNLVHRSWVLRPHDRKSPDRGTRGPATVGLYPKLVPSRLALPGGLSSVAAEITLQRADFEVAPEMGLDPLRRGDGS